MRDESIGLAARYDLLRRAARIRLVCASQLQHVPASAQGLLYAGKYFKHVRIFKSDIPVHIR